MKNTTGLKKVIIDGDVFLTKRSRPTKGDWYLKDVNGAHNLKYCVEDVICEFLDVIIASTLPLEGTGQIERKDV